MIQALSALLLPVVIPFLAWLIWTRWYRTKRLRAGLDPDVRPVVPVGGVLAAIGLLLVLAFGLLWFYAGQGDPPGTIYAPQRATLPDQFPPAASPAAPAPPSSKGDAGYGSPPPH
ncbi:hypothetical protein [Rhodospirillum rubrum]|uniref:hypothetical protein n=1 Tax=Rhodospirillum rubrum TaxID=1085 RepID=UPI001905B818|nr:hypothetical protein [Rhodospirillum rubrum]